MTLHRHSFPYRGKPAALATITPGVPLSEDERDRTQPYIDGEADPTFDVWVDNSISSKKALEATEWLRLCAEQNDVYTIEGAWTKVCFLTEALRDEFVAFLRPKINFEITQEWFEKKVHLEDGCDVEAGSAPNPGHWFANSPGLVASYMGFDIAPLKLRDLLSLADGDINVWYLLAMLPSEHREQWGDEWLNFILGPLAVGIKAAGVGFAQREHVFSASGCHMLLEAMVAGQVTSAVKKDLYEALIARFNNEWWQSEDRGEEAARAIFSGILKDVTPPEIDMGVLHAAIDKVKAENPVQAEKAKDDPKLVGWFMGQVMRAMATKLDPNVVRAAILERL